jgi:hypothetical protein
VPRIKRLKPATIHCTVCGFQISDPPGRKYFVIFGLPWGGLRIEVGCDHHRPEPEGAIAILSSAGCFEAWMRRWEEHLAGECRHPAEGAGAFSS